MAQKPINYQAVALIKDHLTKIHVIGVFSENIEVSLLGNGKEEKLHNKIMYIFSVNFYNHVCFIIGSLEACPRNMSLFYVNNKKHD